MTKVRQFKLFGATEITTLQRKAEKTILHWCDEWLIEDESLQVKCIPADSAFINKNDKKTYLFQCGNGGEWVVVVTNDEVAVELMLRIFCVGKESLDSVKSDHKSFLASYVLRRSLENLSSNLLAQFLGINDQNFDIVTDCTESLEEAFETGSGAVVFEILIGCASLRLILSPKLAVRGCMKNNVVEPTLPSIDFRNVLKNEIFELHVVAGEAEIKIGSLETLMVGDVIRLNTKVEAPFLLTDKDGSRIGNAYLGSLNSNKAVQLAKL